MYNPLYILNEMTRAISPCGRALVWKGRGRCHLTQGWNNYKDLAKPSWALVFYSIIPFLKVKCDHRSKFSNLSNWKEEAWKNQGFNGIRTHDLRDTGAMLYQLSYEATHWEQGQFIEFISHDFATNVWLHSSVGRASHRYRGGHGFESRWSPDFFRLLLSSCLNWKIYCDDHTSLSSTTAVQIWIISYISHNTILVMSANSGVQIMDSGLT